MKERKTKTGKQFGPESWQYDPFDGMSDEEFEQEVASTLRERSTTISLRVPTVMLEQAKAQAARLGVPYQRLLKSLMAAGLDRLSRAS